MKPGLPHAWPLLGHLPAFLRDRLGFLDQCARSGQPVVPLKIGQPTLLLREPADIRYVLQERPTSFQKSPLLTSERGRRLSGNGVLTATGDRHRQLRDQLQPLFTRSSATGFVPAINAVVSAVSDAWKTGDTIDLAQEAPLIARRIIALIVFGSDYTPEIERAFLIRRKYLQYRFDYPFSWSEWLPVPLQFRYAEAMALIDRYLKARFMRERAAPDQSHLLGRMIAAGFSDEEVRDEAVTLAITGYETIGDALTWALASLAADPELQNRVRDEAELTYPSMVFSEALRLYPPTWLFLRHTVQAETLPSGFAVPLGTKVYLSPWVVHRDARFWREPLAFRPDHFLPEEVSERPRLAYFPLGAGPRLCLGIHFANVEGALVLSRLVRDFEFTPVGKLALPKGRMTLCPDGPVRVQVTRTGSNAAGHTRPNRI